MKHKMWSRLLSMALAVMMITSIVPNSAFAEAASEITNSTSQVQVEETPVVENDVPQDEVTVPEEETPVESVEPTAEPTADPMAEPTAEPTQAPEATAVPSEQPSAEPTAAPEATETPNASAQPSETPAPSESPAPSETPAPSASPLPSETPVPTETPAATEEPVVMNEEEYTASVTTDDGVKVEVTVPAGTLPKGAELKVDRLTEGSEGYTQAQNALSETGADGFVALDIRFEVNNEEVEPAQKVQVKVSAENLLPEDADESTVVVQHLKENADNTMTMETVAMAAEMQENQMPQVMAAANDVVNNARAEFGSVGMSENTLTAEFSVDSFSYFTITWTVLYGWGSKTVKIECIDIDTDKGVNNAPENKELWDGKSIQFSNISISGYDFQYATVGDNKAVSIWASANWDWGYKWTVEYTNESNERVPVKENDEIKIYYKKQPVTRPDTVPTVDTSSTIQIDLFDYDPERINERGKFSFGNTGDAYNKWSGDVADRYYNVGVEAVYQDIVAQNGKKASETEKQYYPILNTNITGSSESLQYLFDNSEVSGKTSNMGLNHLFLLDEYQDSGYYVYNSSANFATLEEGSKNFKVYDSHTTGNEKFMPFNDLNSDYSIDDTESKNFYFGMHIGFDMLQPKDGKVFNPSKNANEDMVFQFNGDDDLWVFVDGVLILDLGGIHGAAEGSINFATGEVVVPAKNQSEWENGVSWGIYRNENENMKDNVDWRNITDQHTTIKELMETAGVTGIAYSQNTFADLSKHRVDIYYLERGAGASNCELKFNIQAIQPGSFMVGKQITEANLADYSDVEFTFQAEVKGQSADSKYSQADYQPYKGEYEVYEGSVNNVNAAELIAKRFTNDGKFTLKHNQFAVFSDQLLENDLYRVAEIEATDERYDVLINNAAATKINVSGEQGQYYGKEDLQISTYPAVEFQNQCRVENLYSLNIAKVFGDASGDETFTMMVTIGGKLYTGKVSIKDTAATGAGQEQPMENGLLTLKAGQTASIKSVVWGTSFSVQEIGLDTGTYAYPTYTPEGFTPTQTTNGISGTIPEDLNRNSVTVTVTNSLKGGYLTVEKTVTGLGNDLEALEELKNTLTFTITNDEGQEVAEINKSTDGWEDAWTGNSFSYTLPDVLPVGSYTVTESGYDQLELYKCTSTTDTATAQVSAGKTAKAPFTNSYERATGSLKITKNLKGDLKKGDTQAVFTFKITGPDGVVYFQTVTVDSRNTGSATINNLPAGNYTVEELTNVDYSLADKMANPRSAEITHSEPNAEVEFMNALTGTGLTDDSAVVNRFEKTEEGIVVKQEREWINQKPNPNNTPEE